MLRKIFLAIVLAVILSSCLAVAVIQHPAQAPAINFSTPDEATPDEATADEATPLEAQPYTDIHTEKATENATESQTEVSTEADEHMEYAEPDEPETIEDNPPDDYQEPKYSEEDCYTESPDSDNYSASDREWIARAICLEAGGCSEECQWLVGSTVLNLADRYNDGDIESTVTDPSMFAVAHYLYSREPSATNWAVADRVLSGDRDYQVMAFRTDYYHSFGTPYTVVDNVYFSTY